MYVLILGRNYDVEIVGAGPMLRKVYDKATEILSRHPDLRPGPGGHRYVASWVNEDMSLRMAIEQVPEIR